MATDEARAILQLIGADVTVDAAKYVSELTATPLSSLGEYGFLMMETPTLMMSATSLTKHECQSVKQSMHRIA